MTLDIDSSPAVADLPAVEVEAITVNTDELNAPCASSLEDFGRDEEEPQTLRQARSNGELSTSSDSVRARRRAA